MKGDHLNPRYTDVEKEDKTEVMVRGIIKIGTGQKVWIYNLGKIEVNPDLSKVIEGTLFEIILEDTVDKIVEGNKEMVIKGVVVIIELGLGPGGEHFQETILVVELEVQEIVDQGQEPEPILIGIR